MKLKKVLAAILAVAMVLSFANIAVFAEESDYTWEFTMDNDHQAGITQLNMGVGNIAAVSIMGTVEVTDVESSNPSVANVYAPTEDIDGYDSDAWDEYGNLYIKGIGAGVAYITQTLSNGKKAKLVVVVGEALYVSVTSVTFADNIYSASMYVGDTVTITAVVSPNNATYQGVEWSTDDESVATVSDEGVVTAVGVGTANIKAVSAGPNPHSATRTITVTEVPKVAEIDGKYFTTIAAAVAAAEAGDTIEVIDDVTGENVTVNKSVTIQSDTKVGSASKKTLNNVKFTMASCVEFTVKDLKFTGNSYINANEGTALTVTNCEADVDPAKVGGNSRAAFIVLGTNEPTHGLKLTVTDNVILSAQSSADRYSAAIFGWRYLADGTTITGNTFGSEEKPYAWISAKTMNAMNGATFTIENNNVYGTNEFYNFNAFDLYQNCSRDNEYTAISNNNKIYVDKQNDNNAVRAFYIEANGMGNAIVYDNGTTLNGNPITMANIEIENQKKFVGVDVVRDGVGLIKSGTFNVSPDESYIADGYYVKKNDDDTYSVYIQEATVIETAKGIDYSVTLNELNKNSGVDNGADATYKVVVDEAPEADIQAVETKLAEAVQADAGKTYEKTDTFDIKVIKIENDTEEEVQNVIANQNVTIDLENVANTTKPLAVYHVLNNGSVESVDAAFANEGKQVTFTAPSFSTYSVSYTPVAVNEENITDSIGIAFNKVSDDVYDIVVKAMDDGKKIYRLMSTDLTFGLTPITGALSLSYEISPATYVNLIEKENGRYEFNFNGTGASYATGTEIKIGEVKFIGYGKAKFETTDAATNVVNTAKLVTDGTTTTDDNIVKHYTANGNIAAGEKLLVGNAVLDGSGVIDPVEIKAATKNLTINVKFNNIISDNAATYQDMKVTVSGGDLTSPIVKNFGSDGEITLNGDTYTVEIADTLTKNVGYTVKVEGAGYRTARHIVTMTENKVLNFWNNVKDSANATVIETGKTPMTKNFLAGDIVKDNNINIYDLSAVVSYFGTEDLVSAHHEYAKYDLNRDGVIDSKDVAYVLVSWGE